MNFVITLPRTSLGDNAMWVVADRLTKFARFLVVKTTNSVSKLAGLYVQEIISLYGIPILVVSERDPRFTSRFWTSFEDALGTNISFNNAYHP